MKNLFLTFSLVLFASALIGQSHLMFKIGGNYDYVETRLDDNSLEKPEPFKFLGGHFGMSMDIPIYEDIWSFSPDIQFLVKSSIGSDVQLLQGEIQIPLTFSCYILPDFGVDLGPAVSYRVVNLIEINGELEKNADILEELDFGIAGGVRFKLNDSVMLIARYYYGLRNLIPDLRDQKLFNRSAQISFVYSGGGRGY